VRKEADRPAQPAAHALECSVPAPACHARPARPPPAADSARTLRMSRRRDARVLPFYAACRYSFHAHAAGTGTEHLRRHVRVCALISAAAMLLMARRLDALHFTRPSVRPGCISFRFAFLRLFPGVVERRHEPLSRHRSLCTYLQPAAMPADYAAPRQLPPGLRPPRSSRVVRPTGCFARRRPLEFRRRIVRRHARHAERCRCLFRKGRALRLQPACRPSGRPFFRE